jgi:hypothetical protein
MAELWLGRDGATAVKIATDALTTHAVCVGMTGSGKTGLCVGLIEELAGAGVPVIAIDPKGDLTNLALTEPSPEMAKTWADGQAGWGFGKPEVQRWADKVTVRIWTPGSDAGLSVNVLAALRRPLGEMDDEARRELVLGSVSSLLGLVGESVDPVRSPAHIVLSRILEEAWARGDDPDLEALLGALVDPPFAKVGVFPTDKFYPPDDRFSLAMRLNALLASPAFAAWSTGERLDVPALVAPVGGKTPINIFTIAHLSEQERQFFVGILLDRIAAWTRTLSGSSQLRAVVFFDEVWGYLPPHPKDPPAKRPILSLMKQARAVGVSTILATQNPVDLDYKALSNAGTWLVGRLQTRNDRDRVAEGLTASGMDRAQVDAMLDKVGPRKFVLQQAGKGARIFETRWTRVWLAGPLTRPQLRALAEARGAGRPTRPEVAKVSATVAPKPLASTATPNAPRYAGAQWYLDPRFTFSARLEGAFEPWAEPHRETVHHRPALMVRLALRFDEEKAGYVDERQETRVYFPLEESLPLAPLVLPIRETDLRDTAPPSSSWDPLPHWLDEPKEVERAVKDVVAAVISEETQSMWVNPPLKLNGHPNETREAFDARCGAEVNERIDEALAALKDKYEKRSDALEEKIRRAEERRDREAQTHSSRQTEEWVNVGETVLSFFTGRRKSLTTAASKRRQVMNAAGRVDALDADLAALRDEAYSLEQEIEAKALEITGRERRALAATVEREVRLEREDVRVLGAGVLWIPVSRRV